MSVMESDGYMSLKEFDEKDTDACVATVRMLLFNHVHEGKVIVVVEGADDVTMYGQLFSAGQVCLYADGCCDKHVLILKELNGGYENRLIAIKDADFDRLNGTVYPYRNLLLTDTHDAEGMMLLHGLPLKNLPEEDVKRCEAVDVAALKRELAPVSYLKWQNNKERLGLCFDKTTVNQDFAGYLQAVLANSRPDIVYTSEMHTAFRAAHPDADPDELTNGHDLLEKIYAVAQAADKANFPKKKFFRRVRASYRSSAFSATRLYTSLRAWETQQQIMIFDTGS